MFQVQSLIYPGQKLIDIKNLFFESDQAMRTAWNIMQYIYSNKFYSKTFNCLQSVEIYSNRKGIRNLTNQDASCTSAAALGSLVWCIACFFLSMSVDLSQANYVYSQQELIC